MIGDTLFNLRNRLLGSARFRQWAQKMPVAQLVANHRACELFRLASGFIHSQVLLSCVRLDLFERLRDGPAALETLAAESSVPPQRLAHLLRAAAALGLLEARGETRYGLGPLGAAMVGNESVAAMVEHHALLYRDLEDPLAVFADPAHETALASLWPYASSDEPQALDESDVSAYTQLMSTSQAMIAEQVLDAWSLHSCRSLLDIGGGSGAFVSAAVRRWPDLDATIADLPGVAAIAAQRIEAEGLADRISVVAADATQDELPGGFEVVSLVRIVHDHDEPKALAILRAARQAMAPGGRLLIAEPMADAPGAGRLIDAYFNVYLLAMGSGRPRTFRELRALLEEAGFGDVRRHRTHVPLITSVLSAA